ncbi:MAG TPA: hypothetical protein VN372_04535, partial [Methanospirillum sp.]|nr:hypothetical protein [Methanospirillum sp.]
AQSPIIGVILIIAIILILFVILFLALSGFFDGFFQQGTLAPCLIRVSSVMHTTTSGTMNNASRVVLENCCSTEFLNDDLQAVFLKNGESLLANIYTLHGEGFIPTRHLGVSTIGGAGCRGLYFSPGEKIQIDLKNGYYAPGDEVEVRIYKRSAGQCIAPFTGQLTDSRYTKEWLDENIFGIRDGYRIISQHRYTA